jgi:hypothetical protein
MAGSKGRSWAAAQSGPARPANRPQFSNRGTASCMKSEIHSFAAVRSSASAPRNSTEPSRSETSFARPNMVMSRPFFDPHNDLIRVFMRAVCHTRLDNECPCANF